MTAVSNRYGGSKGLFVDCLREHDTDTRCTGVHDESALASPDGRDGHYTDM